MPNFLSKLFKGSRDKSVLLTTANFFSGFENYTDTSNLKQYQDSLYLYIAVSKIAKRVAGIDLELHKVTNLRGETEEIFEHPVLELLNNPNPIQTAREFMETSVAHYTLAGDVFWYYDRVENSIFTLRPDLVEIKLSADNKTIVAYEYHANTIQIFKPEDIFHTKNPDPSNVLRGIGAIRPARTRILTEQEASKYQANFFKNQGRPDIAVFVDGVVNDEQNEEARQKWKATFRGDGVGGVGFFGSRTKSIQELNKTPKEMDFIASHNFLRDDIASALGVPKAMITTDDVNLANAKEAYRMFLQEAVVPVIDAFVDSMNARLLPIFGEDLFFTFADPTPNDREMMLKEATELKKNGIITANEARAMFEYEAMEGADELTAASSNQNARIELEKKARRVIRTRPHLVKRLKLAASLTELSTAPKREMNSIFASASTKMAFAKAYNDKVDRKANILKDAIDTFHNEQQKRVLESDLTPETFMDSDDEKRHAKAYFMPIVERIYKEGGQSALDTIFGATKAFTHRKSADQFWADEVLLAAIADRVNFFTASITDTTFDVLKRTIVDGLKEGKGPGDIASNIRDYYTDMSVGRANTIARTETGYVLSKATNDAYTQSSVVTGKEWITVGDANVRPAHVENDAKIVAKGGTFPSGEQYPAQHSVNCRCTLAPAV